MDPDQTKTAGQSDTRTHMQLLRMEIAIGLPLVVLAAMALASIVRHADQWGSLIAALSRVRAEQVAAAAPVLAAIAISLALGYVMRSALDLQFWSSGILCTIGVVLLAAHVGSLLPSISEVTVARATLVVLAAALGALAVWRRSREEDASARQERSRRAAETTPSDLSLIRSAWVGAGILLSGLVLAAAVAFVSSRTTPFADEATFWYSVARDILGRGLPKAISGATLQRYEVGVPYLIAWPTLVVSGHQVGSLWFYPLMIYAWYQILFWQLPAPIWARALGISVFSAAVVVNDWMFRLTFGLLYGEGISSLWFAAVVAELLALALRRDRNLSVRQSAGLGFLIGAAAFIKPPLSSVFPIFLLTAVLLGIRFRGWPAKLSLAAAAVARCWHGEWSRTSTRGPRGSGPGFRSQCCPSPRYGMSCPSCSTGHATTRRCCCLSLHALA